MVDYADIGKRIRACRLAKGMTQEQLANEVGVVVTHISHIETGNSVPSLKTLIDIINALDCSADELLCIEIKKAKPVFDSWMTEQLADCSADEAKIIKETVVSLKKSLRKWNRYCTYSGSRCSRQFDDCLSFLLFQVQACCLDCHKRILCTGRQNIVHDLN